MTDLPSHRNESNKDLMKIESMSIRLSYLDNLAIKYTPQTEDPFDALNINNWSKYIAKINPQSRTNHCSFIYKDEIYVIGGYDIGKGNINEISKLNLAEKYNSWTTIKTSGESPSSINHSSSILVGYKLYIFGGYNVDNNPNNNFHELNLETNFWTTLHNFLGSPIPISTMSSNTKSSKVLMKSSFEPSYLPELTSHLMFYWEDRNSIIIYGGFTKLNVNTKIFQYSILQEKWEILLELSNELAFYSTAGVMIENSIFVFGGFDWDNKRVNSFYLIDLVNKNNEPKPLKVTNSKIPNLYPSERSGHTLNLYNNSIFLFGGKCSKMLELNDLWCITLDSSKTKVECELLHPSLLELFQPVQSSNPSLPVSKGMYRYANLFRVSDFCV